MYYLSGVNIDAHVYGNHYNIAFICLMSLAPVIHQKHHQ